MDVGGSGVGGDLPVTLVIKAPSQRQDDHVVDCVLSWTVRKLKEHLENVYPSKPKSNEQRLIYSGKLLQDEKTLKDVLRQYDSEATDNRYTLHLVCSSDTSSKSTEKVNKKKSVSTPAPPRATSSRDVPANNPGNLSASQTGTDGLRYRGATSSQGNENLPQMNAGVPPPGYPGMPGYAGFPIGAYNPYMADASSYDASAAQAYGYTPEQYAVMMQQMYSQYMMQYMQYYQQAYSSANVPPSPGYPYMQQPYPAGAWPQPHVAAAPPVEAANGEAAAANNQAAAPRPNVRRMNAQGGMEDEEEDGEPRDWLHHTYTVMRFLTFLGILFFYSNITRFLLVLSGSFLIYFLQKIRKHMQQRDRNQQAEEEANQQPQNPEGAAENNVNREETDNNGGGEGNENTSPSEGETPDTQPHEENASEANQQNQADQPVVEGNRITRAILFAANTFQTFFTSLIPTPPDLLEAN